MKYEITETGYRDTETGTEFGAVPSLPEYEALLLWEAKGNIPTPLPVLTSSQLLEKARGAMTITSYQLRMALVNANEFDGIQAYMLGLSTSDTIRIGWEFAPNFNRLHESVIAIAALQGITDLVMDAIFEYGKEI